jgi:glyoxylase-like metal-dependent hydrolase (beta-lactamase superfamily II)
MAQCQSLCFNGKEKVLIDTGYISDFKDTKGLIQDLGVDPRNVGLIISTHSHCDHIGGNKAAQDLSGCKIAMHKIEKFFVDSKDDWATWWRYYDQEAEFFRVDLFFQGRYERTFTETMESLIQKGVVLIEGEKYLSTVKA